jgi:hypothetical protein
MYGLLHHLATFIDKQNSMAQGGTALASPDRVLHGYCLTISWIQTDDGIIAPPEAHTNECVPFGSPVHDTQDEVPGTVNDRLHNLSKRALSESQMGVIC